MIGPNAATRPLKGAVGVAGAAVIGDLLIEIAADAGGKAEGQMLRQRPLKMKLGAALIIRRGVDGVDVDAKRAGELQGRTEG